LEEDTAVRASTVAAALPPLYAPWIEEVLGGPVPEERHATCSACAMCRPTNANAATASLTEFDPEIKCCTYVPTLPNFLVGMVLEDDDPAAAAGRESVEQRIAAGIGVTPLGLQTDPRYALIYKHAGGPLFGQPGGFRCPHYQREGGLCGIWRHRNAVCATWFCKHERGAVGRHFWDAVRRLLTMMERHLALWAATELGEELAGLGPALLPYFATTLGPATNPWGPGWVARSPDFYRASAGLVAPLTGSEVRDIGGPELLVIAGQVRAAYGALQNDSMPAYLRLAAVGSCLRADGRHAVPGYSPHDMPILPEPVARALDRFDGRNPTEQVCEELSRECGTPIDRPAVLRLVDFGVLNAGQYREEVSA
jgi:hypothetical protein